MSQAIIGNLRVDMAMNTAAFAAGAKQAQATLSGLQRSISGFGAGVAGILGGIGLNALGSQIVDAMRQVAQIGDLAETIGVTAEQVQVFNRMALQSGASTDAMAKGLQEIAEQSTDANSKLSQLFAANGITAQGRETNAVVRDFMTLLQNARTPTEQLAMATSVLGTRVGRELVEAFRTGAVGVDEATKSMVESGNYHSNAEVERLQKLEEQYNLVAANIATRWQQMVVGIVEGIDSLNKQVDLGFGFKFGAGGSMIDQINDAVAKTKPTVNMGPMGGPGQFPRQPIKVTVLPPDKSETDKVRDQITKAVTPDPIVVDIPPDTIDSIYGTGEAFTDMWAQMSEGLPQANEFNTAFQSIAGTMSNTLGSAIEGLLTGTTDLKDAFKSMSSGISQELAQLSAQLLKGSFLKIISMLAGKMFGGVTIGGMSFGGFYANGGTLGAGKWGIAGEAGPEMVHGPARITPMDRVRGQSPVIVKHTVVNYSGAQIEQQERTGPNGERELLTIIDKRMASQMANPYSQASSALDARGARVATKRR